MPEKPTPSLSSYANETHGWVIVQGPAGLVPPPEIVFHEPLVGPVSFIYQGPYVAS